MRTFPGFIRVAVLITALSVPAHSALQAQVSGVSQAPNAQRTPVQLSLIGPLRLPPLSHPVVFGLALNLLQGNTEGLYGIEIGGFYSRTLGDVGGVQMILGVNVVDGNCLGLQLSAFANVCKSGLGIQASLGANIVNEDYRGIQLSLFANGAEGSFTGLQIGGVNMNNFRGAGSSYDYETDTHTLYFEASRDAKTRGVQIGLYNRSGRMTGMQIGALNYATVLSGFQIGLINIVRDNWLRFMVGLNIGFGSG